jgi:hypothetical protein
MRGIYAGFRTEINANGQRTVTTPVDSIGILGRTLKGSASGAALRP